MSIPNRQIGWSNESNLLWGIAKQMQQLNGILGNGGCCGGASGCITHTDITWDALNAGNAAGTLQDCFYNVTNRPNSGTDPLYVLAEGGRVDLDNEVVRQQAAVGSLCVDSRQKDFGCFNVYAENTSYTVEYVPGVQVIEMRLDPKACQEGWINIGDTVTQVEPLPGGATGTVLWITSTSGGEKEPFCFAYVQVTSGTFDGDGVISNGTYDIKYAYGDRCKDASLLAVGTEVIGVPSNAPWDSALSPKGTITAISGSNITITPTSGSWNGIVVFVVIDKKTETICFYTLTAPIVSVSTQINTETVCWDVTSYLGFGVYLNTLMQATDGLIYGTLNSDYCPPGRGCKQSGQLFSLDPVTNVTNVLFIFDDDKAYGQYPACNVIEIAGELYGTCVGGGDYSVGTIWKWNIATKTFTKLYDIENNIILDGRNPYGGLLNVSGVLYGTCESGGANDAGTLFSYNIGTSTFTKEADFDDVESILYPQGTLVEVNPGELWGTSYNGGTNSNGTIFKYTISSGALEIVINLNDVPNSGSVGGASGGVSLGSDGNVYFNTQNGGYANGGTVCQITDVATTPTLNVLYEFDYDVEGGYTDAVCPIYIDGNVYGVTNEEGGPTRSGTIYKVNVTSGLFTKLHTFNGITDGGYSYLGQLLAIGDELFGMTNGYGPEFPPINYGQIFKYNIATDEYTNIHALNSQAQTSADIASLICASITDPAYTCHTVGNCVYIDGPAGENGYTLALKTVVTYNWCYKVGEVNACAPTVGDTLYNRLDNEGVVIGTIQTVTITSTDPENVCGTMTVELANNDYVPSFVRYLVDETGCIGSIGEVTGSTLSYSVTPFAGGLEPVNLPCYYNVPFDVITEYPLSQKLTKAEIDYLVVNNLLIPGTYYRIIDADFFLYGGTEIVIQAVAPDKFSDIGMGKFYTPKYNQGLEGYGIWDTDNSYSPGDTAIWGGLVWTNLGGVTGVAPSQYNLDYGRFTIPGRIKINISSVSGIFNVNDSVYGYDNSFMGIITEVGTDYLIVQAPPSFFAYPSYETVRYVYDDNTGAEAIMDSVELHADYFSDLIYDVRWDEIKYDYAHDLITYRKDNSGNSVNQEQWECDDWGATAYRNILGMQWGNDFDDNNYVGVGSNIVTGSGVVQLINFKGGRVIGNTFNSSTLFNPTFYPTQTSSFENNLLSSAYISNLQLNTNSSFSFNVLTNGTGIYSMTLSSVSFASNTLSNCSIQLSSIIASIARLNGNGVGAAAGIGAASVIYNGASKDLLSNGVGAPILRWVNGSNVQVISTLTA